LNDFFRRMRRQRVKKALAPTIDRKRHKCVHDETDQKASRQNPSDGSRFALPVPTGKLDESRDQNALSN
jgi:hypothetical protein